MSALKTLLVGCGLIAQVKHLPAIRSLRGQVQLRGVCDTQEAQAKRVAAMGGAPYTFTSLTQGLKELQPDLALICTPPQTHRALSIEALGAGANVLLEKPMALNSADCKAILAQVQKSGKRLTVSFSQSFAPVIRRAHRSVAQGKIGQPVAMQIFLSTPADYMTTKKDHWVHRLPGGVLSETGPHVVHLAMRFLGPIQKASIVTHKHLDLPWSAADDLRITLHCEKGICSAILLYATNQWAARVDISGKEGRLTLDQEMETLVFHKRPDLTPVSVGKSGISEALQSLGTLLGTVSSHLTKSRRTGHQTILEQFVRCIQTGSPPPVDPSEGLAVAEVLEHLATQMESKG